MTAKFATLNHEAHKNLRVRNHTDFAHVKDQHLAPMALHEFVKAASSLPVVFIKPQDDGKFHAVAMMGLTPGENLVIKKGSWDGIYVPASVIIYPFSLARAPREDNETFVMTIDENSPLVSKDDGSALFDDEGNATEFLENCKKTVTAHFDHIQMSKQFIDLLDTKGLITEQGLTVNYGEDQENVNIRGIYAIDEKKLDDLPAEDFEELRKLGLLPVIYAQLASLHQIHRLRGMSLSQQ